VTDLNRILVNANGWIGTHYAIVALMQLPIYTIGTFIAFRKWGYNFVEHLVLNTFLTGQRLILFIVAFPLYYYYSRTTTLRLIDGFMNFIVFGFIMWSLLQFFNNQNKFRTILRVMLSYFIFVILYFSIAGLISQDFICFCEISVANLQII
jgi:hypothetical protein